MWGQKFAYVVTNALTFPFNHFSKIKGLYFYTLLVVGLIFMIGISVLGGSMYQTMTWQKMHMQQEVMAEMPIATLLYFLLSIFLGMLASVPYLIGVTRAAVLEEEVDSSVIGELLKGRVWRFIWACTKIVLTLIPIFIAGALVLFLLAFLVLPFQGDNLSQGGAVAAGLGGVLGGIVFYAFVIYVSVRLLFAPVLAALDKGTSIATSWKLSQGNWWLIALSYFVVALVANIASFLIMFLGALIFVPLGFILGPVLIPVAIFLYIAVTLLIMIPGLAAFGYLYKVLTNQVEFKNPDLKATKAS